jgi:hypothetical protein
MTHHRNYQVYTMTYYMRMEGIYVWYYVRMEGMYSVVLHTMEYTMTYLCTYGGYVQCRTAHDGIYNDLSMYV